MPLFDNPIGHFSFQPIIAIPSESLMYQAEKFRQDKDDLNIPKQQK